MRRHRRIGIGAANGAARGDRVQHGVVDGAARLRRAQAHPRDHGRRVGLRQRRQGCLERERLGGCEQRLGGRSAGDGQLAVERIDRLQRPAHIGDDVDMVVAQHEMPGLGIMARWGKHRVTDEEGEFLPGRALVGERGWIDGPNGPDADWQESLP